MPIPVMPPLSLAKSAPKNIDVLIIGMADNGDAPVIVGADAALLKAAVKKFGQPLAELATSLGAKTRVGTTAVLPAVDGPRLMVVGLGEAAPDPELVRRAAGAAVRAAAGLGKGALNVAVSLETDDPEMVQGVAEGALLGSHSMQKVSKEVPKPSIASITILSDNVSSDTKQAAKDAEIIARNVCLARDWVNVPPNMLYPASFADDARAVGQDAKITVNVLDEKELAAKGYGGILAVGNGSARKPRLVRYSYNPRGATFHLALVGKGITFDSGGLDIKPADGMYTMKCDMGGAAGVLAATRAIAELGLKIQVTCYAAMAENMPSGEAYRPSDVLTMYGGKTVENANTDAEGRLVMADALARANEDNPDMIVDMATLTGACMIALGDRVAGLMASDDQTADFVLDAAETAGEGFWQLPIPEGTLERLESKIADIKSSGPRYGGAMNAAAFLMSFVDEGRPYAHLDIAGPAFNTDKPYGHVGLGGTGVGVRTLVALARAMQG